MPLRCFQGWGRSPSALRLWDALPLHIPMFPGWAGCSLQGHRVHGETLSSESGARGWPPHGGGGRIPFPCAFGHCGIPGPCQPYGFRHGRSLLSSLWVDGSHGHICGTQRSRPLFPEIISPGPLERSHHNYPFLEGILLTRQRLLCPGGFLVCLLPRGLAVRLLSWQPHQPLRKMTFRDKEGAGRSRSGSVLRLFLRLCGLWRMSPSVHGDSLPPFPVTLSPSSRVEADWTADCQVWRLGDC